MPSRLNVVRPEFSLPQQTFAAGDTVATLDGRQFFVLSKLSSADGFSFRLTDLNGKQVQTPANFHPVSAAFARTAAWMRFVFAFNSDFDLYVKEYIRAAGLPVDEKQNWAKWFQYKYSAKLNWLTQDPEILDEAIHQVIITSLAHRKDLTKFDPTRLPADLQKKPVAEQVTAYLEWLFGKRVSEAKEFIQEKLQPKEEISMYQPGDEESGEEGEMNILDTEEHATPGSQGQAEEQADLRELRDQFAAYLAEDETPRDIEKILVVYDYFSMNVGKKLKISDYERYWKEQTGLGFDSLKPIYAKFYRRIGDFMVAAGLVSADKAKARAQAVGVQSSLNVAAADETEYVGDNDPAHMAATLTSDAQVIPNQSAEAGPSTDEKTENQHMENGVPVLDGELRSPERPNVNAMREALDTQREMEVGKPIEQKQEEVETGKTEETKTVDVPAGAKIVININAARPQTEEQIVERTGREPWSIHPDRGAEVEDMDINVEDQDRAQFDEILYKYLHQVDPDNELSIADAVRQMNPRHQKEMMNALYTLHYHDEELEKQSGDQDQVDRTGDKEHDFNTKDAAGSMCECGHHKTYHDMKNKVCHGGTKENPCNCDGRFKKPKTSSDEYENPGFRKSYCAKCRRETKHAVRDDEKQCTVCHTLGTLPKTSALHGQTFSFKLGEVPNDDPGKEVVKEIRQMAKQIGGVEIVLHGRKAKAKDYYKYRGNTDVNVDSGERIAIYAKALASTPEKFEEIQKAVAHIFPESADALKKHQDFVNRVSAEEKTAGPTRFNWQDEPYSTEGPDTSANCPGCHEPLNNAEGPYCAGSFCPQTTDPTDMHEGAAGAAPALAPEPAPEPKKVTLRQPTDAEMRHEHHRFNDAMDKARAKRVPIEQFLQRRLDAIQTPQKLFAFALILENENFHTFNRQVFDKLKRLGWDGSWPKGASLTAARGEGAQLQCNICKKWIPRDDMASHKKDSHNIAIRNAGYGDTGDFPHNPEGGGAQMGPALTVVDKKEAATPGAVAPSAGPQTKSYGSPVGEKKDTDVIDPNQQQEEQDSGSEVDKQPRHRSVMPELPNAEMIMQLNAGQEEEDKYGQDWEACVPPMHCPPPAPWEDIKAGSMDLVAEEMNRMAQEKTASYAQELLQDFMDEAMSHDFLWVKGRYKGMTFSPSSIDEMGSDPHLRGSYRNHPQFGNIGDDMHQVAALMDDLDRGDVVVEADPRATEHLKNLADEYNETLNDEYEQESEGEEGEEGEELESYPDDPMTDEEFAEGGTVEASADKTANPLATVPKVDVSPAPMAAPTANSKRAELRNKIAARRAARVIELKAARKVARLRQVAAEDPAAAGDGLEQLGNAFGELAQSVHALRENLDLAPFNPEEHNDMPIAARLAAAREASKKFASAFRQITAEDPAALEQAVREVYQGLQETQVALENYAENMGLELGMVVGESAFEEAPPSVGPESEEKQLKEEEEHQEEPKAEEPAKEEEKEGDGPAFTSDRDHAGHPREAGFDVEADLLDTKEGADGSNNFVTDRDDKGEPKQPFRVEVPRL